MDKNELIALNTTMEKSAPTDVPVLIALASNLDAQLGNLLSDYKDNYLGTPGADKDDFSLRIEKQVDCRLYELGVPQNHYEKPNDGCTPKPYSTIWRLKIVQFLQPNN